tara:strand:- start:61 stop:249 length:189 start_codon:yes stop_codon:yes gene_type:complete
MKIFLLKKGKWVGWGTGATSSQSLTCYSPAPAAPVAPAAALDGPDRRSGDFVGLFFVVLKDK